MSQPPPATGTKRRQRAEADGRAAEARAADWLRRAGWRVVAERARTPAGEIDIVARRKGVLAFIEVKTRGELDQALAALTPAQCRRIARAAAAWLARHPAGDGEEIRFDVIAAVAGQPVRHLANAWIPGLDDR